MQALINEYLAKYPRQNGEYFFEKCRDDNGNQVDLDQGNLCNHVKFIMKRTIGKACSPHSFRSIVANAYAKKTGNFPITEIWLWHKLNLSSSMYNYVLPDWDLAVRKVNKFIDYLREKGKINC